MRVLPAFLHLTAAHALWAVVLLVIAVAAVILYYRRTIPPLRRSVKIPLVTLRVIAAVVLFLALADALWSAIAVDRSHPEIVVLIDRSGSMNESDGDAQNRFARAIEFTGREIRGRLDGEAQISTFYFDESLYEYATNLPDSFGRATALGDVIGLLGQRAAGLGETRAAVVLSDGAVNRGVDPVGAVRSLGIPVVAVGFGRAGGTGAHIVDASAPDIVYTGQPFEVTAAVQSGSDSGSANVRLTIGGSTVARQQVALSTPGARVPVRFEGTVGTPGMHALRLDLIGADGQVVPAAGRTVFVSALKDRVRVLLLGFTADWEYATLKRYLSHQPRIELIDHVVGKPDWGQPLPNLSEWDAIDIAIYLHPSRADLDEYWAPYAGAMSQSGKGVMFLLDERFARPGAMMCPYPLEFCRRVRGNVRGEYASDPVASRQNHPLVRLDPTADWENTRRMWTERPPWAGVVVFDSLPDNADVLVQTVVSARQLEVPLMWTRPNGRGRSVVLAAGPLWRWVAEEAAAGRVPDQYNTLWGNTLRWLTLADDADRLAVRTDREVYHSGEPIVIEGLVFDEAYRFLDRAVVTAQIWRDTVGTDTVHVFLNPGAGDRFVASLSALTAGTYRYDGTAEFGGTSAHLSGGVFRVESYGLEEQYSGLDEALLRAVAAESGPGGRYISEHESLPYLDSLDWMTITRERPVEFPLGNHWLVLAIFIAALSVEWFVRRRQQLL